MSTAKTARHLWMKRDSRWGEKELSQGLRTLKRLASIFQIRRLYSVLIFSILGHPCSFMVYHHLYCVFLSY